MSTPEAGNAWSYVFPFLYGFLIASDPRFEAALRRSRWPALAVGCAATGALVAWAGALSGSGAGLGTGVPPGWSALQGLAGWAWIVAIMGFAGSITARRRHPQASADSRPCRGARAPVAACRPVRRTRPCCPSTCCMSQSSWRLPGSSSAGTPRLSAEYAALVIVSFAATLALYEAG